MSNEDKSTPPAKLPVGDVEPSDEFEQAFGSLGSIVIDCEFCGRTHYADCNNEGDFDEGELEYYRAQAEQNPDKVIPHSYSSVCWGYIAGKQYVFGCPCKGARAYEDFIWRHRGSIVDYLSRRAKVAAAQAKEIQELAAQASVAVNQPTPSEER